MLYNWLKANHSLQVGFDIDQIVKSTNSGLKIHINVGIVVKPTQWLQIHVNVGIILKPTSGYK